MVSESTSAGESSGKCVEIGYALFREDRVEPVPEERAVAKCLSLLKKCVEEGYCSRGIVLSGSISPIRRASVSYYEALIASTIDLSVSAGSTVAVLKKNIMEFLLQNPSYAGGPIELVAEHRGVIAGIREGKYIVVPSPGSSVLDPVPLDPSMIPLLAHLIYPVLKCIRRVEFSLSTPTPPILDTCKDRGARIECYRYRGSSRCIYNQDYRCPLRILYRKPPAPHIGSAEFWAERALETFRRGSRYLSRSMDYALSMFLSSYAACLCALTGRVVGKLMGVNGNWDQDFEEHLKLARRAQLMLRSINRRLSRLVELLIDEAEKVWGNPSPYQAKTMMFIIIDGIPYRLLLLSRYVLNTSAYKVCRPAGVRSETIKAFIDRFFPLIKGKIAHEVAERIAMHIEELGCIEPSDLLGLMDEKLATRLLEELARRGLLQRVRSSESPVFRLNE